MTETATTRNVITLCLTCAEAAACLEELLWTLDGVESVEYQYNTNEALTGLQVIGTHPQLLEAAATLCSEAGLSDQVTFERPGAIAEEDWAESWKRHWHVHRILPNVVIQPSWEAFTPAPTDVVLRLDPGSAFGTGTHETTQLMLWLMRDLLSSPEQLPQSLLDVGTGSGILAIYGAKLGISRCVGIDNDPVAVAVARQNGEENGVNHKASWSGEDITTISAAGGYDWVLANILASVILGMLPDLKAALNAGGTLFLSGITRKQYADIAAGLRENGLAATRVLQKGEWLTLACKATSR